MKKLLLPLLLLLITASFGFAQDTELNTEGLDKKTIKLIKEKNFQEVQTKVTGKGTRHEVITVDRWAMYPDGLEGLEKFLKVNLKADKVKGVNGKVIVGFTIEEDGSLGEIEIVQGLSPQADKEVLRVLMMMEKWIPASRDGEKVNLNYVHGFTIGEKTETAGGE